MLAKRIIPCLDVRDGVVVKGVQFKNHEVVGSIVDLAQRYADEGADELVFYDITASAHGNKVDKSWVAKIAEVINIPFAVAGGIRSIEQAQEILAFGADKISINTAGVNNPDLIGESAALHGSQCIVVAIDARRRDRADPSKGWEVFTHGGRTATGLDAVEWAKKVTALGAGEILLTSMDCDGTKQGFDLELTRTVSEAVSVPVIASGGVGNLDHLVEGVTIGKADAVLAASIFHFGEYSVRQAKKYMAEKGITVRL